MIQEKSNKTKQQGNSGPFTSSTSKGNYNVVGHSSTKKGPFSPEGDSDEETKSFSNRTPNHSFDFVPSFFSGTLENLKGNRNAKPNEIISSIFDYPTESNDGSGRRDAIESHTPPVAPRQLFSPSRPLAVTSDIPPPIPIPIASSNNGQLKKGVVQFSLFDVFRSYETLFIVLLLILSPVLLHISDIITSIVQIQYIYLTAWLSSIWPRIMELSVPVETFITNARELANRFVDQTIINASYTIDSTKTQLLLATEKAIPCVAVGVVISLVLDWDMTRFDKVLKASWVALPSMWSIPPLVSFCMTAFKFCVSVVIETLQTIFRLPWIIQSTLQYRLAFYFVGVFSLALTVRWVCHNVITAAASTAASYGPAGLKVIVSAAVTFLVVTVIWFLFNRRRRRIAAERDVVNSVVLYVKHQLSEVHKGEPHPVEYFYEDIADKWRQPTYSSYSFSSATTPLHSTHSTSASEPFLRVPGVQWSLGLWKQVQREVEKDRRVLVVDVEVDGASRRCWRMQTGQSTKKLWPWFTGN
eukprot:gene30435-39678_t